VNTLYLVATPIGNLEDISGRAIRVLKEVRLIAAEDTRHTKKLLSHYNITTHLTSYFEQNKISKIFTILSELEKGDVALVSDAGTPALNDPGYELVKAAIQSGYDVSPIPGPSAPVAALVCSGLPPDKFLYLGYLPRKVQERNKLLQKHNNLRYTLVALEVANRLESSLLSLLEQLGNREIVIARELTKIHEEFYRGTVKDALQRFQDRPARGEITIIIQGCERIDDKYAPEDLSGLINKKIAEGKSAKTITLELIDISGWKKKELYDFVVQFKAKMVE
jgi:16S rRNA (cytidine1402-2'-O)-methyltransferase